MIFPPLHRIVVLVTALITIAGCTDIDRDLRIAKPVLYIDQKIVTEFSVLMNEQSSISLSIVDLENSEQSVIEALIDDRADIALISNNQPFTAEIATVMPMYANVLHILIKTPSEATDVVELFNKGRVFAGTSNSASRTILLQFAADLGIDPTDINFVTEADNCPDVIVLFAPIVRHTSSSFSQCNYEMQNLEQTYADGRQNFMGAAMLFQPSLRSFEIPARTYGPKITPEPVVTMAVDKILVARHDVPLPLIYDLIGEISRLRPALSAIEPSLFFGLKDHFDPLDSTYMLHPGALDYFNRQEPSVYERYSGIADFAFTLFVALLSGSVAAVRIYSIRRKNRIDVFYLKAIEVRRSVNDTSGKKERHSAISAIRALQTNAFELLVDEKLAADESFRIFITLSNEIIRELKEPSAPDWGLPED